MGNPSTLLMNRCLLRGEEQLTDYCLRGIDLAHGSDENGRDLHISSQKLLHEESDLELICPFLRIFAAAC